MERISEHISYEECKVSEAAERLGIDNTPDEFHIKRMKLVAEKCFEPIRKHWGKPIRINSMYRCLEVNNAIGGSSKTSQHMQGEAIDMTTCEDDAKLFEWIKKNIEYDQLIWEYGTDKQPAWIHISYTEQRPNRQQTLRVQLVNGKMVWTVIP